MMLQFDRLMVFVKRFHSSKVVYQFNANRNKVTDLCAKYSINTILEAIEVNENNCMQKHFLSDIEKYCEKLYRLN